MKELGIWDPLSVRIQVRHHCSSLLPLKLLYYMVIRYQVLKTAVETSVMLLRIDDIVSG